MSEKPTFTEGLEEVEELGLTDLGSLAHWSVSSHKAGCGVEALRSDDHQLFWQSDGPQPHHLDIHFSKRVSIERVSIYTDYELDESYTPSKIKILAGSGYHDLLEVTEVDLDEPQGWTHLVLDGLREDGVLKTYLLRLLIPANHQHGKDTHLRAVKVYGPRKHMVMDDSIFAFTTPQMFSEQVIR
ncbi:Anaphase-promoting complex subunit 10 [Yarrowia sp. B02]|nr:Anaphase-promoting complex subunit 10 [Yarrowia sp. B02]